MKRRATGTEHVKLANGVPTCTRCGETEAAPLPAPIRAFCKWLEYFAEKHRGCKAPVAGGDMTPKRIQRRRTKGAQLPDRAIVVTRPGRWGNPFRLDGTIDERQAAKWGWSVALCQAIAGMHPLEAFEAAVLTFSDNSAARVRTALGGRDLACWCRLCPAHADGKPLGTKCDDCAPCHADTLLKISNEGA